LTEFMKAVERREPMVYDEDAMDPRETLYMLAPIVVGFAGSVIGLFYFIYAFSEEDLLILILILGIPPTIGAALTFGIAFKLTVRASKLGVRGVSRGLLSATILYLDMLLEGHTESIKIVGPSPPDEINRYALSGLSSTSLVLKRIDPENFRIHRQLLKEKREATWSLGKTLFMNYGVFALIILAGLMITAIALPSLNLVPEEVAEAGSILTTIAGFLMVCIIGIYLRKNNERKPSEELRSAMLEPDLKSETRLILDRLLGTLLSEGEHPLRVLTTNEYNELTYTGNTYMTSNDIKLREALLIPHCFNR
jgi:hypothetical protein